MGLPADILVRAWYQSSAWLWVLRPVEAAFRAVAAIRRGLFHRGWLKQYRAPVPVVVVGNITVGGTGKTPVVIALVESLLQRGISVGVVSRGYGGAAGASPHWVDSHSTPRHCGDEPLLIHRRTGCPCVVASSRAHAVHTLLARSPVEIIISDDGLQHYALARDMEIAVLDQQRGTGNGFCLPAGPLREPLERLQSVDYVLYRHGSNAQDAVQYIPVAMVNLSSGERRPPNPEAFGIDVHAVAGLGQPGQFLAGLRRVGFRPQVRSFPDHHRYAAADFAGLSDKPIIMTEKDAVKCAGLAGDQAWYLEIRAQLPQVVLSAVVALARP